MKGKYRYIYNKKTQTEELYDIDYDPNQNFNLIHDDIYDVDRNATSPAREYYFYPEWDELPAVRQELRAEKNRIWRDVNSRQKGIMAIMNSLRNNKLTHAILKPLKHLYINMKTKK